MRNVYYAAAASAGEEFNVGHGEEEQRRRERYVQSYVTKLSQDVGRRRQR